MAKSNSRDYVSNPELLAEILKSQALLEKYPEDVRDQHITDCLTPRLVELIMLMIENIATSYQWRGYSWIDDMKGDARLTMCRVALKFNVEKAGAYPNAFAYYTTIIRRCFMTYRDKEKKQGAIRDEIIMSTPDSGLLPSFAKQFENEKTSDGNDLDGTKTVEPNPYLRRRRKKPKVAKADDTKNMTEAEEQRWLDAKVAEFKKNKDQS